MTHLPDQSDEPSRHLAWLWPLLAAGIIILAGFAAYSNTFHSPFVFDDGRSIKENPTIRRLWPIQQVLSGGSRPVLNLSLAINYRIGKLDVVHYHAFNLAVHILAALTLFGVVRRTLTHAGCGPRNGERGRSDDPRPACSAPHSAAALALCVALIWELHPLTTQAVTYVIQRAESLMGLFYLLTLYCMIRGARSRHPGPWCFAAVAACAFGMGTKEVMASAPLIALLYDRTFIAGSFKEAFRRRWGLYIALAATWLLLLPAFLVAVGTTDSSAGFSLRGISSFDYAKTQLGVILHYLRLSFWPRPLCLDYAWQLASGAGEILPGAILVGGLLAGTLWALARRPGWGFLGAWFFLILAPTSSIMPIADLAFEHRMYLPLAAVAAAAVMGAFRLGQALLPRLPAAEPARRSLAWGLSTALILVVAGTLGHLTFLRNADYRTKTSIWEDTARKRPANPRAHCSLAIALDQAGETDRAIVEYTKAIELKPDYVEAYVNRADAYCQKGWYDLAIAECNKAIELGKTSAAAHYNRGNAYLKKGRLDLAIADYDIAIRLRPAHADAYINRGTAHYRKGQDDIALRDYEKGIELALEPAEAYNNRGLIRRRRGQYDLAIQDHNQAVKLMPDRAEAYYNRGNTFFEMGEYARAILDYSKAVELKPDYAEAYDDLGITRVQREELDQAIRNYDKAIELKPNYAKAYHDRAFAYYRKGEYQKAINDYTKAIELPPGHPEAYKHRGVALAALGKYETALHDFDKAIELKPDDGEAYLNRGAAHCYLGRYDAAIRDCDMAITLKPNSAEAYCNRGNAYIQKRGYDRAIQDCSRAIELKPDYATAYGNRAVAHLGKKEFDRAWTDVGMVKKLGGTPASNLIMALTKESGRSE